MFSLFYSDQCLKHDIPGHIESKQRLIHTKKFLIESGIWDSVKVRDCRKAKTGELMLCHSKWYLDYVVGACANSVSLDPDTPLVPGSLDAALYSAGGAVQAGEWAARHGESFALIRPPGHHAFADRGSGFCIFNNIAISSKNLIEKGYRVAVFDCDVHHCNGTQSLMENEDSFLLVSMHQSPAYPGTGINSKGNAVNLKLPPGTDHIHYMKVFDEIALPELRKFKPDIIGVSFGSDSHFMTRRIMPYADLRLRSIDYKDIIRELRKLGRVFCLLEGGYEPGSLARSTANIICELAGLEKGFADEVAPEPSGPEVKYKIDQLIKDWHGT